MKKGDPGLADRVSPAYPPAGLANQAVEVGFMSGRSNVVFWLEQQGLEASKTLVDAISQHAGCDHILSDARSRRSSPPRPDAHRRRRGRLAATVPTPPPARAVDELSCSGSPGATSRRAAPAPDRSSRRPGAGPPETVPRPGPPTRRRAAPASAAGVLEPSVLSRDRARRRPASRAASICVNRGAPARHGCCGRRSPTRRCGCRSLHGHNIRPSSPRRNARRSGAERQLARLEDAELVPQPAASSIGAPPRDPHLRSCSIQAHNSGGVRDSTGASTIPTGSSSRAPRSPRPRRSSSRSTSMGVAPPSCSGARSRAPR